MTDFQSLPILDFSQFESKNEETKQKFVEELRLACHFCGFFYVKNHPVGEQLCKEVFEETRKFFALPYNEKMKMENVYSKHFRGYTPIGKEVTDGAIDNREQIDFGFETQVEEDLENKPLYHGLHGPNQWPPEGLCPNFRKTLSKFMEKLEVLSISLMRALALSLQLPEDYFDKTFADKPHIRMKVIRYPGVEETASIGKSELKFGVGQHKDYGFLSLLLQDNIGGLQALNGNGEWIDAIPVEGTFVVNLGEMLEICTGGYYIATVHRVINKSHTNDRISIPYFFNPRLDAEILPIKLPDNYSIERGLKEPPKDPNNHLYSIYGENAFKGLTRSHPDVVKVHYPQLIEM